MSSVTVRFVHRESHTPVMEVEAAASATVGALRGLLVGRLASDEFSMMRVFAKWHAEVVLPGGQKRLVELTAADEDEPLHSLGIIHLSEVHLEGPLIGDCIEGVAQGLGVLGAQLQQMRADISSTKELLKQSHTMLAALLGAQRTTQQELQAQRSFNHLLLLPNEADGYRRAVEAEEGMAFARLHEAAAGCSAWLRLPHDAEAGYSKLYVEYVKGMDRLAKLCHLSVQCPHFFTIDKATPNRVFSISEDGVTATKTSNGYATFRASKPLSQASCRWAVRMVKESATCVGLLPKLSANPVGGKCVYDLGGWCIWYNGDVLGNWQCETGKVTFTQGDLVTFDYSFAAKTLTISCNRKRFVGRIPSIKDGDELYPAVSMYTGEVRFERYPN